MLLILCEYLKQIPVARRPRSPGRRRRGAAALRAQVQSQEVHPAAVIRLPGPQDVPQDRLPPADGASGRPRRTPRRPRPGGRAAPPSAASAVIGGSAANSCGWLLLTTSCFCTPLQLFYRATPDPFFACFSAWNNALGGPGFACRAGGKGVGLSGAALQNHWFGGGLCRNDGAR
jgi:hypothetical protein